jgi:hypothetical protein
MAHRPSADAVNSSPTGIPARSHPTGMVIAQSPTATVLRTIRRLTQRLSASATSDISGGVRHSVGDGNYVAGVKTRRCGRSEEPPLTARIRQRHITTTLSAVRAHRGTEGSNPFPSSKESRANRVS